MPGSIEEIARILVRAVPGSSTSGVVGQYGDAWKIRVRSVPERGRANSELVSILSKLLQVPVSAIVVTAGAGSRDKHVVIRGLAQDHVVAQLRTASVDR